MQNYWLNHPYEELAGPNVRPLGYPKSGRFHTHKFAIKSIEIESFATRKFSANCPAILDQLTLVIISLWAGDRAPEVLFKKPLLIFHLLISRFKSAHFICNYINQQIQIIVMRRNCDIRFLNSEMKPNRLVERGGFRKLDGRYTAPPTSGEEHRHASSYSDGPAWWINKSWGLLANIGERKRLYFRTFRVEFY